MGQQKFCCPASLLLTEDINGAQSGVESPAKPQNIAAFNGVISGKRPEVEPVHTERSCKCSHGGEQFTDPLHLTFHFREQAYADCHQYADCCGPDQKRRPSLAQFMFHDCHCVPPPSW